MRKLKFQIPELVMIVLRLEPSISASLSNILSTMLLALS